jgi:hypothetical protein
VEAHGISCGAIVVDKDRDKDCDNDLNPEPFSSPLACGAARTPLPYLARSAFP